MREVDGSPAVSGCRATAVSENRAAAAGTQQQEPAASLAAASLAA
ncbi:MAG TPA: hypothetical protein VK561_04520 [Bradyrhizobium sp.]|nr:hypothetical protein [Bradyrhizobium sp.]HTE97143.1 hypothetical protein [Bradyrhizobium sp.]